MVDTDRGAAAIMKRPLERRNARMIPTKKEQRSAAYFWNEAQAQDLRGFGSLLSLFLLCCG